MFKSSTLVAFVLLSLAPGTSHGADLRVGTAAVALEGDDSMVVAGGIHPRFVKGQEGQLRALAIVIQKPQGTKLAIVAVDILMMTRELLDPVVDEIERECQIPAANIMIHSTHTHHAPSTMRVHGYDRDEVFCRRVQRAVVKAAVEANAGVTDAVFHFKQGEEKTVGQNSRILLADGSIYWTGSRDGAVRPTGPFDTELPVLIFRDTLGKPLATIFNHSTHTIGAVTGNFRSPAFYGMAAQELESEIGGAFCFLEGASGSTHRLDVSPPEAAQRIKQAIRDASADAQPRPVDRLVAIKRPFRFKVRTFDEAAEEKAASDYCSERFGVRAEATLEVFRKMRKELAPHQGESRTSWIQAMLIGDVALVGVPAEFFTKLGRDIKERSPLEYTYVAELSNDWIGYLPDREAHRLGGYQVWTGFHSYAEPGTGERMVDEVVGMLKELGKKP
jgi:neutral ceramidase